VTTALTKAPGRRTDLPPLIRKAFMKPTSLFAALSLIAALTWPLPLQAGPGHDHGHDHAAPAASGQALPRFAAESELFELVGVLEGRRLTLYLDRSADNVPVQGAKIELEIAGARFVAQPHGEQADAYEVVLPVEPRPELLPVIATVSAGSDIDLLAGELDLHEHARADEAAPARSWPAYGPWAAGAVAGLALLIVIGRRLAAGRQDRAGASA
jgi:hypothetical protein